MTRGARFLDFARNAPTTGRSVAHVQNPVYSDDQASFCFDIASLKHVFGLVLPKVCFSHTPQPRLKHTFAILQQKLCFNASPA